MKKLLSSLCILACVSFSSLASIQNVKSALEDENLNAAEQAFSLLNEESKSSIDGQVLQGRILLQKEETEDAFDYFEEMSEEHSENVDVQYYLGVSSVIMAQKASIFSKLGYAEAFLKAMEKTVTLKPDHLDALETLIGFHLAAPSIAGGDTDKAVEYAKQIQRFDEEKGLAKLVSVYWRTEENEKAELTFQQGVEKYPESSDLYYSAGLAQMKLESWEDAFTNLAKSVEFSDDKEQKFRALYQQGKVSVLSGLYVEKGIKALVQVSENSSLEFANWGQFRLAQLYMKNENYAQAKTLLTNVDYNDDEELEDKVKSLKKKLKRKS